MLRAIQRTVCRSSRMFAGRKSFVRIFAPVSLGLFLTTGVIAVPSSPTSNAAEPTASVKRQSASAQFARAEEQRATLNAKPPDKRSLAEYKQVVMSYRRVRLITPRAPEVPDSLVAVGELYTEMGDRFGRSYYQLGVDSYEFLVREYPAHKYCQEALLRIAKLQRDNLAEATQSQKTYEEFLKRYPRSPRRREVEEALAELALLQSRDGTSTQTSREDRESSAVARTIAVEEARPSTPVHSGGTSLSATGSAEIPRVRRVRTSLNGDATRVTIDLDNTVEFTSGRISSPDRIFFDLHAARHPRRGRSADRGSRGAKPCGRCARGAGRERRQRIHRGAHKGSDAAGDRSLREFLRRGTTAHGQRQARRQGRNGGVSLNRSDRQQPSARQPNGRGKEPGWGYSGGLRTVARRQFQTHGHGLVRCLQQWNQLSVKPAGHAAEHQQPEVKVSQGFGTGREAGVGPPGELAATPARRTEYLDTHARAEDWPHRH